MTRVLNGSEGLQLVLKPLQITMECFQKLNFPCFLLKDVTLSSVTVLSSNPSHKSTTLARKDFCPNVSFGFFNNVYFRPRVTLFGANSKNFTRCSTSFPVIISSIHTSIAPWAQRP